MALHQLRVLFLFYFDAPTLTADLVFRTFVSEAYLILFGLGIPNLACACILAQEICTL